MDQHLSKDPEKDARGAAGNARAAQLVQNADRLGAEQERDCLPV